MFLDSQMLLQYVMHVTDAGTIVTKIRSLEDLADYSLKEIEVHPWIPHGGAPKIIVLQKGTNDRYRVDDATYKALKFEYMGSGANNERVGFLINDIDIQLKQLPKQHPTSLSLHYLL